jgi:ketosteroid isomerase-like protein
MPVPVPKAIAEYFQAANGDDPDRVAACFAEDAVVKDERRGTSGRAAIRAWAEETQRKYRYHAEIKNVEKQAVRYVVTAHLTGDFPGSPIDLNYRFKLNGAEIVSLEIG